ncbi:hypothetical protein, partial [Janthinobacterium sp.]|uniref:hypothetical protein n=1 Tax=Janthinobacterium sp. TaxID=1871054 RepID=UPI00258EFF47
WIEYCSVLVIKFSLKRLSSLVAYLAAATGDDTEKNCQKSHLLSLAVNIFRPCDGAQVNDLEICPYVQA